MSITEMAHISCIFVMSVIYNHLLDIKEYLTLKHALSCPSIFTNILLYISHKAEKQFLKYGKILMSRLRVKPCIFFPSYEYYIFMGNSRKLHLKKIKGLAVLIACMAPCLFFCYLSFTFSIL